MTTGRTLFIGDVHGCLDELKLLLDKLQVTTNDRVILLGDLVNKGPKSIETIKFVYQKEYECVMGNNDYYAIHHKWNYLKGLLTSTELKWFSKLPLYIEEKKFIVVHAGLHPKYDLADTPTRFLISVRKINGEPWHELYNGEKPVIYGHWAAQGLSVLPNFENPLTIGLDTGCVYGKELTAYILETKEIVQVKAKKTYLEIK